MEEEKRVDVSFPKDFKKIETPTAVLQCISS